MIPADGHDMRGDSAGHESESVRHIDGERFFEFVDEHEFRPRFSGSGQWRFL
jgi:hypothetical protein